MENRQRSKTIFRRSVVVLTALALISCCFVGSTLGRYVTKKSGTFDSGVALWKITETVTAGEGAVDVNLVKISPSKSPAAVTESADSDSGYILTTKRSKALTNITVKIKNEGDVNAYVMLELGEVSGYKYVFDEENGSRKVQDNAYTFPSNEDPDEPNIPTQGEWEAIFTATWGTAEITTPSTEGNQQGTTTTAEKVTAEGAYKDMYLVKPRETLSVAVTIKWNTDLDGDTVSPDGAGCIDADYRDTWIGENIGKISLAYSWYAVQGSETPDTTQGN
ncbi:MAG TPA: hypothetical protein H9964_08100 [Candidatus Gallimonas intestinavium]|uniref:Uncharacterized protein n=1 Tax=Candidatus Gallimonas intestinavium TaxID=2838603 RepID=A0A9D2G775_9FIRM|nr:hypothetical protein [Candidatus Gallimonas intestinavium]